MLKPCGGIIKINGKIHVVKENTPLYPLSRGTFDPVLNI